MYIPDEIQNIITSYLILCDRCGKYHIGPYRRCGICFPQMGLCSECYYYSGLSHLSCLSCGRCGMCNCFGKHTHGWYVDYYGGNLQYTNDVGTVIPVQPANVDDYINNIIINNPAPLIIPTPPDENDIVVEYNENIVINPNE